MMGMPLEKQIAYDAMRNVNKYQPPVDIDYLARGNNQTDYTKKQYGETGNSDNIIAMKDFVMNDLYGKEKITSSYRKVA